MTTTATLANHPVYTRVAALPPRYPWAKGVDGRYGEDPAQPPLPQYLTTAEVAKLLREHLKREFKGVRFSVRSDTYSMGSSIDVRWQGGPLTAAVERVTRDYVFSGFDGMIDLKFSRDHWLLPDGTLSFAHTNGTVGSRGVYEARSEPAPHPKAILVSGGPDHVFCRREE